MLFTSLNFFILVIITFVLYYLVRREAIQIGILVLTSFIFYAWNFPILLSLLIISIAINILLSSQIKKVKTEKHKYIFAFLGVVINLLVLAFFKYSPLIGKTFFSKASSIGEFLIAIPLPIGISFFTFQGISLIVDTFRDNLGEDKELSRTPFLGKALYIAFFPQLIAGPIVKAHEFLPQIGVKVLAKIDWDFCFKNLVTGYFLKMVVADNLKDQTFWMAYPYFENSSIISLVAMLFGYSMQIFADFAGYSLIAIGLAGLFGYKLSDNFLFPYISASFSEFWRRWHISLSTFLREYLYIPLGGNRKGPIRTYFNLFITMVLGGLWHGAAWSYAVWGAYHGLVLAIERFFKNRFGSIKGFKWVKILWIFSVVTFGWLLFKLPDFSHVVKYLVAVTKNNPVNISTYLQLYFIGLFSLPIIIYHLLYFYQNQGIIKRVLKADYILYGTLLFFILTNSGSSGDFIYFQF